MRESRRPPCLRTFTLRLYTGSGKDSVVGGTEVKGRQLLLQTAYMWPGYTRVFLRLFRRRIRTVGVELEEADPRMKYGRMQSHHVRRFDEQLKRVHVLSSRDEPDLACATITRMHRRAFSVRYPFSSDVAVSEQNISFR